MKALRLNCERDNGSGNDGMIVFENQGEIKFECEETDADENIEPEFVSVYLSRDSVKELVAYLSDWLVKPFQGPW